MTATEPAAPKLPLACALLFGAAMVSTPLWAHTDDGDAQLYRVVSRHIVETGRWLDLSYLPEVHPRFREHLPFGLWPYAAAVQFGGERAVEVVGVAAALAILALVGGLARRLSGTWAAVVTVLVLATNDSVINVLSQPRLDAPLVLLATLSAAPLLLGRTGARDIAVAVLFGGLAAAVKGPFGLVPLFAASVSRAAVDRTWRPLFLGGVASLLALAPVIGFLLHDRWAADGTWWSGYVQQQLLASATGSRSDGQSAWWFPLRAFGSRFWPGLPLVVLGWVLAVVRRDRTMRVLALHSLLMLAVLCLPTRKLWFHGFVAWPGMALLAGHAVSGFLERRLGSAERQRQAGLALGSLALIAWGAHASGFTVWAKPPYVYCTDFAPVFSAEPPGTRALVIGHWPWHATSSLAAEFRWTPRVALTSDPAEAREALDRAVRDDLRYAVVETALFPAPPEGWTVRAAERGWSVLQR